MPKGRHGLQSRVGPSLRSPPGRPVAKLQPPHPWPASEAGLRRLQLTLGEDRPPPWSPFEWPPRAGACFVCFGRGGSGPGRRGDQGWSAAVSANRTGQRQESVVTGRAPAPYVPGLLAWREGALLERAVRALPELPEVLIVNATGRDHPRRCGLAFHLGARLGIPSVGVTHRPLAADGPWPAGGKGATSPLILDGESVGQWLRTTDRTRPLAVHAGWRTSPETAVRVVRSVTVRYRTPQPLREARRLAREARAEAEKTRRAG
ncbi:MAG: endonuclease V [Dehalococcoidia bacterium]